MDDEKLQAWLAQHGGEVGRKDNERDTDGPTDPNTGAPTKVRAVDSTTITAQDGATITLRRNPGPFVGDTQPYTVIGNEPPKPKETKPAGPKGDMQSIGGRWREYNPQTGQYDIDHGPSTAPPAPERPSVVATNTTEPYIVINDGKGNLTSKPNPNYRGPEQKPGATVQIKGSDGKTYFVPIDGNGKPGAPVDSGVPADAPSPYADVQQDPDTKKWYGFTKGGKWVEIPGGPGAADAGPKKPGPAMPTFVVGMSSAALQAFGDQLNASVAAGDMTAPERAKRFAEAVQMAQHVVSEARVIQESQQSSLNANINLATTKYANQMDGLNNALKFVSDLNGKLPEGSDLGGKAFAAMLGMQAIIARRSGINDIRPGQPYSMAAPGSAPAPPSRLTNPADSAAVAQDQLAVAAQLQEAVAEADRQFAATQQSAAPIPGAPTAGEPGGPPLGNQHPVAPTPGAAPGTPARDDWSTAPRDNPMMTVRNRATGETQQMPLSHTIGRNDLDMQDPNTGAWLPLGSPPPMKQDVPAPQMGQPGYQDQAPLWEPKPPPMQSGAGGNVQMAPPPDQEFAIMNQMQSPAAAPMAAQPDLSGHPLLLRSRAETTPPWRLSEDEVAQMRAAGLDDETILGVPGFGRQVA